MSGPVAGRLQSLAVRTEAGPLRPLWATGHAAVIRGVARRLTAGLPGTHVYLKGGFGFGRPVYGLSDVDMVVVTPDAASAAGSQDPATVVRERWRALSERYPFLAELFNDSEVFVYRAGDAALLRDDSYLTFGRKDGPMRDDRAAFLGRDAPEDPMALLDHPGLFGAQRDWRAVGAPRRPPAPAGPEQRAIDAWLELRFIWGYAFRTCLDPARASAPYTCLKLVADSARVWLWLAHGEQLFDRTEVLERALQLVPEEEAALSRALDLRHRLRHAPDPPLAETLPFLVRMSSRVARELTRRGEPAERTNVELHFKRADGALPLVDWRARAIPGRLDAEFSVWPGDPGDPGAIVAAAAASTDSTFPALRAGPLLVFPIAEIWHRGRLRAVECEVTDPVSFALHAGKQSAVFPNLPGWSAEDSARRAVTEHRAWLALNPTVDSSRLPYWVDAVRDPSLAVVHGLFSAARCALFAESLAAGAAELSLTPTAIASQLADHRPEARAVVAAACGQLLQARAGGPAPSAGTVSALLEVVCDLAPYRTIDCDQRAG